MNSRLHILLLADGLPGHVNQARGLVKWLASRYEVDCIEVEVQLRLRALARLLMPLLLRMGVPGCRLVRSFYRLPDAVLDRPQLIVSAGGNTSFLNVALARTWRVPNIFLGSKRRLRSDDFSAHLTLEPTGEPHNIVMELVPTPTDVEEQREKGAALRRELGIGPGQRLYALVIGGDGAGFQYDERAWRQIADLATALAQRDQCRWLVTTSRRTGAKAEQLLRQHLDPAILVDAVWWSEQPRKVMNAYLGAADAVFVTADSMSMINECISSEKPVILLELSAAKPEQRYCDALARFETYGYCRILRVGQSAPDIPVAALKLDTARANLLAALESLGIGKIAERADDD